MTDIDSAISNALTRESSKRQISCLRERFPALKACNNSQFLSLEKYLDCIPYQLFSEAASETFLSWLDERHTRSSAALKSYLQVNEAEIDQAFLHLEEINSYQWHDELLPDDEFQTTRFIDQRIHPAYLRLLEAVFAPFLRIPAHFNRIDRTAGTMGLDLWSIVQELQGGVFAGTLQSYKHVVRNGIGHGGIIYGARTICYRDKKDNKEEYDHREIVRLFDDLLDTCNGLCLGLSLFLLIRKNDGYDIPRQLLIEELCAETRAPWWEIVGCIPSQIPGKRQLVIYARCGTSDHRKVTFSVVQSGILAERFVSGFNRYVFSLRSERAWPGFAALDGDQLRVLREQNRPFEEYGNVLEDKLVFYMPRIRIPRFFAWLETLWISLRLHWRQACADYRKQIGKADVMSRGAKIHRNGWGCVLRGQVWLPDIGATPDQEAIRQSSRRIIQAALSEARRDASRLRIVRYLPLGFARISVFRRNYRKRRLVNFGLSKDLICTVQIQRIRRISAPDISGSTVEQHGQYRIAWNRSWLEERARF